MKSRKAWLAGAFLALCLSAGASAQPALRDVDEFGTQDGIDLWIPAAQFTAVGLGVPPGSWMCCVPGSNSEGYYFNSSYTGKGFEALVALPQGAFLDSWRAFYYDNSASVNFHIELDKYFDDITASPTRSVAVFLPTFDSSGTPGFANHHETVGVTIDLREPSGPGVTRNQAADFYVFSVGMPADQNVGFKGVRIFWHRQVSPAPATATFNDVPTSDPGFQYIEALVASGVTAGCNTSPPMYCPDATLTRRQMAVFLAKALGLHWPPF